MEFDLPIRVVSGGLRLAVLLRNVPEYMSSLTGIPRTTRSAESEWYMPLVGRMQEDSFSRQCR